MNLKKIITLAFFAMAHSLFGADIDGFWLVPDDDNGDKIQSAVVVYEYKGQRYCKMLTIYDEDTEKLTETIKKPIERAQGIQGNPYLCGLDFIWGLKYDENSKRYKGHVVDPDSGNVYRCKVWYDSDKKMLVVRGELFVFGENEYWPPADTKFLPDDLRPDVSKLVPNTAGLYKVN